MSERIHSKEHRGSPENGHEANTHLQEVLKQKVERARSDAEHHKKSLETARHETERHAEPAQKVEDESSEAPDELHTFAGHQLLKSEAYHQLLSQAQRKLSKRSRMLSKFIHRPAIETASEIGSKTAARPSGLLGGGIGAFLGSCVLLYTSKTYGFEYNFSLFIILFCAGFIAGLVTEVLVRTFKKR